jgi:hypothetical protein
MKVSVCATTWLIAGFSILGATTLQAAPFDGRPKILLHVSAPTAKNACSLGRLSNCGNARAQGDLYPNLYWVFLLAAKGSQPSVGSLECGVQYEEGREQDISDGIGVDIFAWAPCQTRQSPLPGFNPWPAPGSGNLISWNPVDSCQTGEVAVAGYFYVGAYSLDTLRVVPSPVDGIAKMADCSGTVTQLRDNDLGFAIFSPHQTIPGCNPCVELCPPEGVPAVQSTWSAVKTRVWRTANAVGNRR